MYAENQELKKTYYNGVSLHYRPWLQHTGSLYAEWREAVGDCVGEEILAHRNISQGLTMTQFENGKTVFVNYTNEDATVDGVLVKAESWAAKTE